MRRRGTVIPLLLMIALAMINCQGQKSKIDNVECKLDEGIVLWHDVHLTNNSGKDLHEVNLTLTLIGEDGKPRSEDKYYVQWSNGETIKVSLSRSNSPRNVQKISLTGSCEEGTFDKTWATPPRFNSNTNT